MKFIEVLNEAITKEVLFIHVDCGAFTPYRYNKQSNCIEYWDESNNKWEISEFSNHDSNCDDWIVTKKPVKNYETIVYV